MGQNTNAVNAISEFLQEETDENRRLGVVIFDEVKLREEIQFSDCTPTDMKNSLANHALVFMFVPLLFSWVQPVAVYVLSLIHI